MFSPALGRAVRSTSSIPASSVCTLGRVAAAQQTLARPPQQRRLSSSKASSSPKTLVPPPRSNDSKSGPAGEAKVADKKTTGKAGKRKAATAFNLPHVPPTDYLQKPEVRRASFFSLHRPLSVTAEGYPPVSSMATFESIFQRQTTTSRRNMMGNIQTLAGGIERLEAALHVYEQKGADDVHHLDGKPEILQHELMGHFRPFTPPPAPLPLDQVTEMEEMSSQQESLPVAPVKQRSWSTEVVVTESTDPAGNRTYATSATPMVEIDAPGMEIGQDMDEIEIRQPFLERMRQRRNEQTRPGMLAISVKRQRKLKMKKHKYKKLMKRTRLLRRKLDRL